MNKNQIDYLSNKIIKIVNHIEEQIAAKRDMTAAYNREIKDSKNRMVVYSKAIASESIEPLHEIMGEFEMSEFEKMGRTASRGE